MLSLVEKPSNSQTNAVPRFFSILLVYSKQCRPKIVTTFPTLFQLNFNQSTLFQHCSNNICLAFYVKLEKNVCSGSGSKRFLLPTGSNLLNLYIRISTFRDKLLISDVFSVFLLYDCTSIKSLIFSGYCPCVYL